MIDRVNLIPDELKAKKTTVKLPFKYLTVLGLGLIYIATFHIGISKKVNEMDKKIAALKETKLKLAAAEKLMDRIDLIKKTSATLTEVVKKRIYWSDILKEMSHIIPQDLWLKSLSSRDTTIVVDIEGSDETVEKLYKELIIKGSAYKNETIKTFVENLENSYFLDKIKLSYTQKRTINKVFTTYEFEVVSKLKES
jgi:Tfp pilus assembly protein PilN